nr:MAG TPA: hypothetical protein [Caudoviricetes sp.]
MIFPFCQTNSPPFLKICIKKPLCHHITVLFF